MTASPGLVQDAV